MAMSDLDLPRPKNDQPAIRRLVDWLDEHKSYGYVDRPEIDNGANPFQRIPFITKESLSTYLTHIKLKQLLEAVDRQELSRLVDKLLEHCQIVFTILILIDRGHTIRGFIDDCIRWGDRSLHWIGDQSAEHFPGGKDHFQKFCRVRHHFLPARFDSSLSGNIDSDRILPFKSVQMIGQGASAEVFKVEVLEGFSGFRSLSTRRAGSADAALQQVFVLKRFRSIDPQSDTNTIYDREKSILEDFDGDEERNPGIVGFYGCYALAEIDIKSRQRRPVSWNIILEFADLGNLNDLFESEVNRQPTSAAACWSFWNQLAILFDALCRIRRVNVKGEFKHGAAFQGAHHDIKPSNILVATDHENPSDPFPYRFMLADFGLASRTRMHDRHSDTSRPDPGATQECGAPEAARHKGELGWKLKVTPEVDIWSLACVLSQCLVWWNLGPQKWQKFAEQRAQENRHRVACFHDDEDLLRCVQKYHRKAIDSAPSGDDFTRQIVDLLENEMLIIKDDERARIDHLRDQMANILRRSKAAKPGMVREEPPPRPSPRPGTGSDWIPTLQPEHENPQPGSGDLEVNGDGSPVGKPLNERTPTKRRADTLSRIELREWIRDGQPENRPAISYRDRLLGRDIVFIVDDSKTMGAYAPQIEQLIQELATLLKPCDPDGMELMFLSNAPRHKSRHSTSLLERVRQRRGRYHTSTNAEVFLERIFKEYAQRWEQAREKHAAKSKRVSTFGKVTDTLLERFRSSEVKPVSYFILTDAVWQDNSRVEEPIGELLGKLSALNAADQVAISFIRFGNDFHGKQRLQMLDQDLVRKYGGKYGFDRDVVDHTRWDGDVLKMILGPSDSQWDEIGEDETQES